MAGAAPAAGSRVDPACPQTITGEIRNDVHEIK